MACRSEANPQNEEGSVNQEVLRGTASRGGQPWPGKVYDSGRKVLSLVTKRGKVCFVLFLLLFVFVFFLYLGKQPGYLSHLNLEGSTQNVGILLIGFNIVL